ncbi:HAMP domain-containing histidine kinase [Candidatus Peregrinibacteria bacterium]|nr:MAG: HAMP domain-containing histidine kinase [Candidatus Peregrinibacteria bacterium]
MANKRTPKEKERSFIDLLRFWQNLPVTFFGITLSGALVLSLFLAIEDTLYAQNEKYLHTLGEMVSSHFPAELLEKLQSSHNGVPEDISEIMRHVFAQSSDIYSLQILTKTNHSNELQVLFSDHRFDRDRNGDGSISESEEAVPVGRILSIEQSDWFLDAFTETKVNPDIVFDALGALRRVASPIFSFGTVNKRTNAIVLMEIDQKYHVQNLNAVRWHFLGIFLGIILLIILVSSFFAQQERIRHHLEQTNMLKDKFVGIVSHELRTPLTVIRGFIEFFHKEKYGPINRQQKSILEKIHRNASDLLHLVNDMLDIQKLEIGKMQFQKQTFLVSYLVENVVQDFQVICEEKQLSLDITHLNDASTPVFADPEKTREVLINLIGNAAKFTPEGGNIELSFSKSLRQGFLTISVKNTGVGIPPEEQERIFEKFHQVENKELGKAKGTGLGLSIAKEIVRQMDGEIWLTSEIGNGTTFFFTLPLSYESQKNSHH